MLQRKFATKQTDRSNPQTYAARKVVQRIHNSLNRSDVPEFHIE